MCWLREIIFKVKLLATPGTVIASAMWGADVVNFSNGAICDDVLHYRSVPPKFANDMMAGTGIPKYEWSRLMGHVQAEFYQPVFINAFQKTYSGKSYCSHIFPLADWITAELSGQQGHDPVMFHNQGLGVPTSKLVNCHFCPNDLSDFSPMWKIFSYDELLPVKNDAYIMPCSHDSTFARAVLASTGLPWGLWTGSWYGVFRAVKDGDKIVPSEKTYKAGLVFEAMPNNGLSAISNIGMDGPKYKALKNIKGKISYKEASQLALTKITQAVGDKLVFPAELLEKEAGIFAKNALTLAKGDLALALATMANTITENSIKALDDAALALGMQSPNGIAIVGGFAENTAILKALACHGLSNINIPPFAGMATQAGVAAEALRRAGIAPSIEEALKMIPDKKLD